jgi:hypothetical protein
LAIGATRAAGRRLILAKCNEPGERVWFETVSCCQRARQQLDVAVLAAGYEGVYRRLLDRAAGRSGRRSVPVQVPVEAGGRSRPA